MNHDAIERTKKAVDWFVRICTDELSEPELAQWIEWCNTEENAAEFQRIRAINQKVELLRPEALTLLEELLPNENSLGGAQAHDPSRADPLGRRNRGSRLPIAAALAGLSGAVLWYAVQSGWMSTHPPAETPRAMLHSAVLPDGSNMIVAPRTNLALDFSGVTRELELSQGEVFFKVRRDKMRPFVVRAGGISATAVGTEFDVSAEANRVVVTVQEGTVDVARNKTPSAGSGSWRLTPGFRAIFDATSRSVKVSTVDADAALAWREGRLNYYNEPIRAVVADVNRYSIHNVEIGDPRVGNLTFTGTIFIAQIDDWLEAMQSTFPIRVTRQGPDHAVLTATGMDMR